MDDYLSLIVLSYFKQQETYTITNLSKLLGISIDHMLAILNLLIDSSYLEYSNSLLQLTPKGRLLLQNRQEDVYAFDGLPIEIPKANPSSAWSLDKIYVPDGFNKKI